MSDHRANRLHADGRDMTDGLFGYIIKPAEMPVRPDADRGDSNAIVNMLRHNGWLSAVTLVQLLGWEDGEAGKRRVRQAASDSRGAICSYPGSPGYKLRSLLTPEERSHAIAAFKAQAAEMFRRASELELTDVEQGQKMLSVVHGNGATNENV